MDWISVTETPQNDPSSGAKLFEICVGENQKGLLTFGCFTSGLLRPISSCDMHVTRDGGKKETRRQRSAKFSSRFPFAAVLANSMPLVGLSAA